MAYAMMSPSKEAPPCPWQAAARQWPDRTAFALASGGAMTWAELDEQIQRAQQAIASIESHVLGYVVSNTERDAIMLAASLREGRELMLFGHRLPEAKLQKQCDEHQATWIPPLPTPTIAVNHSSDIAEYPLTGATCIQTSGSTGVARWIRHSAIAHLNSARAAVRRLDLSHEDRWSWCLPSNHVGGLSILWRNALIGATTQVVPQGVVLSDWLSERADSEAPTVVSLVPTQLKDLLALGTVPPASLHSVIVGGAALSHDLLSRALASGWPIRTTYGMTETASMVTLSEVWSNVDQPMHVGKPLDHAELCSRSGRIHIKSAAIGDQLADPDGWMPTSDRGAKNEKGQWVIGGRLDRVIISGGENLDPVRIESAIRGLADIEDVRVLGIPDARYGQRPVAFVESAEPIPPRTWFTQALSTVLAPYEVPDLFLRMPRTDPGEAKPSASRLTALALTHQDVSGDQKGDN